MSNRNDLELIQGIVDAHSYAIDAPDSDKWIRSAEYTLEAIGLVLNGHQDHCVVQEFLAATPEPVAEGPSEPTDEWKARYARREP
jgi:hypothetical protein